MSIFSEGQSYYSGPENKVDANLFDWLMSEYDDLRKEGVPFLSARTEALKKIGIPGPWWESYLSALSTEVARRRRENKEKYGDKNPKKLKKCLKEEPVKLSEALLSDIRRTKRERGWDPDEDEDELIY